MGLWVDLWTDTMNELKQNPGLVIVMGVSGSGKTVLAKKIAKICSCDFIEADNFHSEEAKAHMASGKPLTDAMREPWIQRLLAELSAKHAANKKVVLAYSGLKREHRERFRQLPYGKNVMFLVLEGPRALIKSRMRKRKNHFMPESLLDSQFDAMEDPRGEPGVVILDTRCSRSELNLKAKTVVEEFFTPI